MECWFWNIDVDSQNYFVKELDNNRLRQGWGYEPGLDLRILQGKVSTGTAFTPEEETAWSRCVPMLRDINRDDLIAVKNIPTSEYFTIIRVVGDYPSVPM